ncbi:MULTISPECIES: hypothetical protein [unclassified Cohnella]|nr:MULTISPECIES: hypothetical protein [unclassified Cohnella]
MSSYSRSASGIAYLGWLFLQVPGVLQQAAERGSDIDAVGSLIAD